MTACEKLYDELDWESLADRRLRQLFIKSKMASRLPTYLSGITIDFSAINKTPVIKSF